MLEILLYFHQLPQHLLGMLLVRLFRATPVTRYGVAYYETTLNIGVSLGRYVILHRHADRNSVLHEHGHQIQSVRQGWLYLLVVGLPSLIGNRIAYYAHKDDAWYYAQPWEKRADQLGGVRR